MFKIQNGVLVKYEGSGIADVEIPNGVKEIGAGAFKFNKEIESVILPNTVTTISDGAFGYCKSLKEIKLPNSMISIDKLAFAGCEALEEIKLPDGIITIEEGAFSSCSSLKRVILPNTVVNIKKEAFSCCKSIETMQLPNSVQNIEPKAFYLCDNLREIKLSQKLAVCDAAFYGCKSLTNFIIDESAMFCISNNALYSKDGKKLIHGFPSISGHYSVQEGTEEIGSYAFYKIEGLTSINIPESVRVIDPSAFSGCIGLCDENGIAIVKDIFVKNCGDSEIFELPANIKYISEDAFSSNETLKEIVFSQALTYIGDSAFEQCKALEKVELPYYVSFVGACAFDGCVSLESISFPGSLKVIPYYCCSDCTNLKEVMLHEGTLRIENNAFDGSSALKQLHIPYGVTSLGSIFASGDDVLEHVYIPETVHEIDQYAFTVEGLEFHVQPNSYALRFAQQNQDLYDFVITDTPASEFNAKETQPNPFICNDGELVAMLNSSQEIVNVPEEIEVIGKKAFASSGVKRVILPSSVKSINEQAFLGCKELKEIILLSEEIDIGSAAFAECTSLEKVVVLAKTANFSADSFFKNEADKILYENKNICIYCAFDSSALKYAIDRQLNYAIIKDYEPTLSVDEIITLCETAKQKMVNTARFEIEGSELKHFDSINIEKGSIVCIPDFIKSIGENAFASSHDVSEIILPNGLVSIGEKAFSYSGITKITIPESVESIGNYAFEHCLNLKSIHFMENELTFGEGVFSSSGIVQIDLPLISELPVNAFLECMDLERIDLPETLLKVNKGAFKECRSLKQLILPKNVLEIDEEAFENCYDLMYVCIPDSTVTLNRIFGKSLLPCILLCNEESFAQQYADEHGIPWREYSEQVIKNIEYGINLKNSEHEEKIELLNTTILLSSNLYIYNDLIKFYAGKADAIYEECLKLFDKALDHPVKDAVDGLLSSLEHTAMDTNNSLQGYGIYIEKPKDKLYMLNPALQKIIPLMSAIVEFLKDIGESSADTIRMQGAEIIANAKSKITGLGYGIITSSSLMLAAHALDQYLAKKQQTKEATRQVNRELQILQEQVLNNMSEQYQEFMYGSIYPVMRSAIYDFVEDLFDTHTHLLTVKGILPEDIEKQYDYKKSMALITDDLTASSQKESILGAALKYCPYNLAAYYRIIELGLESSELEHMANIAGLGKELQEIKSKIKEKQELDRKKRQEELAEQQRRTLQERKKQEIAQRKAYKQELEMKIDGLQKELSSLKGLFTGKRKRELEKEIAELQNQITYLGNDD